MHISPQSHRNKRANPRASLVISHLPLPFQIFFFGLCFVAHFHVPAWHCSHAVTLPSVGISFSISNEVPGNIPTSENLNSIQFCCRAGDCQAESLEKASDDNVHNRPLSITALDWISGHFT
jgi:hypothetical protein